MKKKILSAIFAGGLAATLFISGCTKDVGKLPVSALPQSACDSVTYTKHIKPILEASCLSCHGTSPQPGAPVLASYSDAKANAALIKSTTVDGTPVIMPQGSDPLPQAQKDLIVCWVSNGMKE